MKQRHSWQQITPLVRVCRHCGFIKTHIRIDDRHRDEYTRAGRTHRAAPPCDRSWPIGWHPHGMKSAATALSSAAMSRPAMPP